MSALDDEFAELELAVERLLALLGETDERFWSSYLERGLR